ncbi:MAG: hypothetical protein LBM75_09545 [Myxococcales bacterium]|jgi:hypothetical protein|nr:hypothetical protein [Myxococcales bacterium]
MVQKIILGVRLKHRNNSAPNLQELLTRHGCVIRTRIGLHEVSDNACSPSGTIILELHGPAENTQALEDELRTCSDLVIQKMVFEI